MTLSCTNLTLGYGERSVIETLSMTPPAGRITTLIGPNGCGKSTLLLGLAGLAIPQHGEVKLDGKALSSWPRKAVARRIAFLSQTSLAPEGITVKEMVRHGRFPHRSLFGGEQEADRVAVEWALSATRLTEFSDRMLTELSGGERQRACIAMALAQQADILLLDEPTTYLDLGHQLEVLELLSELNKTRGMTVVMSLHDLNHAIRYSDHAVVIESGHIAASGVPSEIITPVLLRRVFGIRATLIKRGEGQVPVCYPEQTCNEPYLVHPSGKNHDDRLSA